MMAADRVFAVSKRTRAEIVHNYGIDHRKVVVRHTAVNMEMPETEKLSPHDKFAVDKVVTFFGRITSVHSLASIDRLVRESMEISRLRRGSLGYRESRFFLST